MGRKTTMTTTAAAALTLMIAPFAGSPAVAASAPSPHCVSEAGGAPASPQLPGIPDTWTGQGVWNQTGSLQVDHPRLGPLEIRTYFQATSGPGSAPSTGDGAYAVYQDGRAVGFASSEGGQAVGFGPDQVQPVPEIDLPDGGNVDIHGNVYLVGDGLTVLTPTESGYDSRGTLPSSDGSAPFAQAQLVDADPESGEPRIRVQDGPGEFTDYRWVDGEFQAG
ncbi:hypothetical protein NBM05_01145 [Rothia sp. AR01]|uniref:Uncharacterized protein n=1 Tax=Rothia santali TaxID=2949643 RepID=A0A9X2KH00_9MICC|nr:hypothetical protein [Rothia santali]MCP3424673.1 hypothetical protein [Rothia santali]